MAKAGGKSITWILLSEAWASAVNFYQDREYAERQLTEWLSADKLHWRSEHPEGSKRDCDPGSGDPEFWCEPARSYFPSPHDGLIFINPCSMIITWEKSRALRNSYTFRRIEVAEEDLVKLLPASSPRQEKISKRRWRLDEIAPVVDEMFPGGPPKDKPTVELVKQLGKELKQRGIRDVSEPTMERALGRRR